MLYLHTWFRAAASGRPQEADETRDANAGIRLAFFLERRSIIRTEIRQVFFQKPATVQRASTYPETAWNDDYM